MFPFFEKRQQTIDFNQVENLAFPAHLHPEIEIIYVRTGEVTLHLNQQSFHLETDDLAIIFPNLVHRYEALTTQSENNVDLMIVDPHYIHEFSTLFQQFEPRIPVISQFSKMQPIHDTLQGIYENLKTETIEGAFLSRGYYHLLLAFIFPQLTLIEKDDSIELPITEKVIQYIANHFHEPLSLNVLATTFNYSPFTLSRIFSKQLGISFPDYLKQVRINAAKNLLKNSNTPILEIALHCGFETQRSFNRSFKEFENTTPREYRKKH